MALVGWWPLNGDTNDYSGYGNHGTLVGGPSSDTGKIGSAYYFTSDSHYVSIPHNEMLSKKVFGISDVFSLAGWVYIETLANWACIINKASGGSWSNATAGLWISDADGISFAMGSSVDGNPSGSYCRVSYPKANISLNRWYHVAGVADGTKMHLYINGVLIGSANISLPYGRNENTQPIIIGRRTAGTAPTLRGKINDVRVYDHALSTKDVKELAKAKILHYKFDDFQEPTQNLILSNRLTFVTGWSTYQGSTATITQNQIVNEWGTTKATRIQTTGGTNTVKYLISVVSPSVAGKYYAVSCKVKNIGTTNLIVTNNLGATETVLPGEVKYVKLVSVGNGTSNTQIQFRSSDSESLDFLAFEPQVEEKDHVTPFVDGSRGGVVHDCSGYGNHATLELSTTPKWTSNSKIGTGAYEFDGNQTVINAPMLSSLGYQSFTVNMWAYFDESGTRDILFGNYSYTPYFNIEKYTSNQLRFCWNASPDIFTSANTLPIGQWCMITCVRDKENGTVRLYMNGQSIYNQPNAITDLSLGGSNFCIGKDTRDGDTVLKGKIDDVRIYMTALSDSDILDLYRTKATLDNIGNFYVLGVKEYSSWDPLTRKNNLVENGCQEYKNNYNFPNFTYDASQNCLSITSGSATVLSSNFIEINGNGLNSWDQYRLECEIKGKDITSKYYFMIDCYDRYKRRITNESVNVRANTATTLAQDLKSGDTYAYVNDITNWYDDGTTNYYHAKGLAVWHPDDESVYTPYVYTKRWLAVKEVDKVNKRLGLNAAYSGITIPAGSPAQNHQSGSTYSYIGASNASTNLNQWEFKYGLSSRTPNVDSMRYGTSYVKIGFMINRDAVGGTPTTLVKNLKLYNVDRPQASRPLYLKGMSMSETGLLTCNQVSEVGPTAGLIGYWKLDSDANDYSGNGKHGVVTGAVLKSGIIGGAYEFAADQRILVSNFSIGKFASFSAWGYSTSFSSGVMLFSCDVNLGPDLYFTSGTICWNIGDGSANPFKNNGVNVTYPSLNEWHHYCVVNDYGLSKALLYIDGVYAGEAIYRSSEQTNKSFTIGNYVPSTTAYAWKGKIDDVRVYNRTLSAEEIWILYRLGAPNNGLLQESSNGILYVKNKLILL